MRNRRTIAIVGMSQDEAAGSKTLTHRSRAAAQFSASLGNGTSNFVLHRRMKQQNRSPSQAQLNYVLPFYRINSSKSFVLTIIGSCALILSLMSIMLAHSMHTLSEHNPSGVMILPLAKEWGAGRERRRKKRQQAEELIETVENENAIVNTLKKPKRVRNWKQEVVLPVKSQVFEAHLASFYTKLAEVGATESLSFHEQDALGQDMSIYANIGCSTYNKLFQSKSNNTDSFTESRDTIRRFWQSHHDSILDASRLGDKSFAHKNWTWTLLKSLSPYTLADSLSPGKGLNAKDVERILGIVVRRLLGLMQANDGTPLPPPLRIAIFGGPTVAGQGCHRGRGYSRASMQTTPAFCSFPYRLEQFLNWMLLPPSVLKHVSGIGSRVATIPMVDVVNLGEEGTYSDYSEAIARNRMYPPLKSPDVVIHAYGIDDYGMGNSDIEPFYSALHKSFERDLKDGCRKEDQKPPPVVLRVLLETNETAADLVMTSILGDAIDDVEEGETYLPELEDGTGVNVRGGAFGMAGHAATSWGIAFDLAHAALNHCASYDKKDSANQVSISKQPSHEEYQYQCDNGMHPPCIFSIYSGSNGNVPRPSFLLQSLSPFVVENTGWSPSSDMTAGFSRKTGIVASTSGATMAMLFQNITRPVGRFDVITLRSTSQIWRDGVAQFSLVTGGDFSRHKDAAGASVETSKETSFEISAELVADVEEDVHVTSHFGIDLVDGENAAEAGSDVLLRITLTKGDKFKILGLMLCE
ncbi:hypothetical protein ACHAXN_013298 [Cyclotella atomus]